MSINDEDLKELEALLLEEQKDQAREHMAPFVRASWPVLEPATRLRWNWHLDEICDHLEAVSFGRCQNLLINIPPGHMKSLLVCVFWPAWHWGSVSPSWRVLFGSYAEDLSIRDSMKCRDLIQSDFYQELFRPKWKLKVDQNVKSWFENDAHGLRQALSVGGKGTGFRGDCVVFDDPHNVSIKERPSLEALADARRWWFRRMTNRLNDPEKGAKVGIMQRVHDNDLAGHCIATGRYWHLCMPSHFDPARKYKTPISEDPRTKPGELLFEGLFTEKVLQSFKEDLGTVDFNSQYEELTTPPGGEIIKEAWLVRRYEVTPDQPGEFMMSWDLKAGSKDPKSSFVVGQVWFRPRAYPARRYIIDQVRGQWDIVETMAAVKAFCDKWPQAKRKIVEKKADGAAVVRIMEKTIPGLVAIKPPDGNKENRLRAVAPFFEAGNIYLPVAAPWLSDYEYELTHFPAAPNDDQVDATSQALLYWDDRAGDTAGKYKRAAAGARRLLRLA